MAVDRRCSIKNDLACKGAEKQRIFDKNRKQFAQINGHKLAFYFCKNGKNTVVLLHGWGANAQSFSYVISKLCVKYSVLAVDFCGFGDSDYPPEDYGVKQYADDVIKLLEVLNIEQATLVGHSFGGRVAVEIAANYPHLTKKLVLVDSAGVKPRRGIKYYAKVLAHKFLKSFGAKGFKGSSDYSALPECMKGVFVRVVNYNQNGLFKRITCPTAVFWGDKDKVTPPYMYRYILKKVKDSYGFMLKGGHFAYVEDGVRFVGILDKFLEE